LAFGSLDLGRMFGLITLVENIDHEQTVEAGIGFGLLVNLGKQDD